MLCNVLMHHLGGGLAPPGYFRTIFVFECGTWYREQPFQCFVCRDFGNRVRFCPLSGLYRCCRRPGSVHRPATQFLRLVILLICRVLNKLPSLWMTCLIYCVNVSSPILLIFLINQWINRLLLLPTEISG